MLDKLSLVALEDDKHYFPPYEAVPVVRAETLPNMRRRNYEADAEHQDPATIGRTFLQAHPEILK